MQGTRILPPLFLLGLLVLVVLGHVSLAQEYPVVELEFKSAGVVKPGYQYQFRLHAVSLYAPVGLVLYSYAFADAGLSIDGSRVGITGEDGVGIGQDVYVLLPGEMRKIETNYTPGQREYDATVTLTAYCIGEIVDGVNPGLDRFVIKIEYDGAGGSYTKYIVKQPGGDANIGVPIQQFYERAEVPVFGTKESWVQPVEGYPVKFKDCGDYAGPDPSPGDDTRQDKPGGNDQQIDVEKYALYGLGTVAALGALAILTRR